MRQRRSISKFWQAHIEAQRSSGLSISRYCKEHGLKYHQFHYHKKQVCREQQSSPSLGSFVPIKISAPKPITVELASGHKISFDSTLDGRWLAEFMRAMEAS